MHPHRASYHWRGRTWKPQAAHHSCQRYRTLLLPMALGRLRARQSRQISMVGKLFLGACHRRSHRCHSRSRSRPRVVVILHRHSHDRHRRSHHHDHHQCKTPLEPCSRVSRRHSCGGAQSFGLSSGSDLHGRTRRKPCTQCDEDEKADQTSSIASSERGPSCNEACIEQPLHNRNGQGGRDGAGGTCGGSGAAKVVAAPSRGTTLRFRLSARRNSLLALMAVAECGFSCLYW